ncbi:hypothetical protein Tco_0744451 [Tanacetum coccineum]
MYDGERLHSTKIIIDSPDSDETLEDAEESRLRMKNKMIQLNYAKLNALYETFVPQKEFSAEQTYFSTPTSNVSSESSKEISDLPTLKMPNESKLLKMFDEMDEAILALRKNIDVTLLKDEKRIYIDDGQNTLRQFYKTNVIMMSLSLIKHSKELKQELKQELNEEVQEMLNIFDSIEKKVETQSQKDNMFQNEIDRLLEASFTKSEIVYSMVKGALFTSLVAAKSRNLGATSVVTKSRFSVAKTPTAKNKVSSASLISPDSSQSRTLGDPARPLDYCHRVLEAYDWYSSTAKKFCREIHRNSLLQE